MEEASLKLEQMNNILQRLQHPLQCGICLHMLSSPITTKCNHSYCAICMDHLLKSSRGPVRCPLCLAPVTKRSLWLNDKVVNILSAVKEVIDSVKADCGFIASPRKNSVVSATAKEITENSDEEMDEPRRGTRKRHFMPMCDSSMPFENERKSKRPHVPSYVDNDKVKLQEFPVAPSNRGRGRGRGRGTVNKSQTTSQHVPVNSVAKWIESSSKLHFKVGVTYSQATEALLNDSQSKASSEMSSSGSSSTVLFECNEKKDDADCDDLPDIEMVDTRNTVNNKQPVKSNSSTSLKKSSDQKKVNAIDEYLNSKKFDDGSADTGSVDSLNKENLQDNANVGTKALNNTVNAGIENAAMPPPLAPLSRSVPNTRSTRQSTKNVQPGTNFRYASNMKRQLFEPVKTAATSIDVKDTKSPGWSHIVRAKRDLKNRHIGLNITGGDGKLNMLNSASVSKSLDDDNLISSVETQVFIDDQTQKVPPVVFDVEHLDMMPEKQGNVDKLRSMVKHFGSCDLKSTKDRQNAPNTNSDGPVEVPGNSSNCDTSDEVTKLSDGKASDSKLSSKLSHDIHGVYEHVIADTLGTVDGRTRNDSKSPDSDKDHSSSSNMTDVNDKVSEHQKSDSSHSSNSEPKSKFSNSVHRKIISYEEQECEFSEYDIIPTVYKSKSCQAEILNCKASIGTQSVSHTEHVAVQTVNARDFTCDRYIQTDVKNDSEDVENSQTEICRPNICCKKLQSILRQCLSASPCKVCQTAIKLLKVLAEHSDLEDPHSGGVKRNSLSSSIVEASHKSTAFPPVIPLPIDSTCQVTVTQTVADKELDPSLSSTVILPPLSTIKGIPDEDIAKLCVKATSKTDEPSLRITTRQKSKKDVKDVDLFATEKPKGKTLRAKADNKAFTMKRETSNSTRSFKRIRGTEPDSPDGKAGKKFKEDVSHIAAINDISSQSYASTLSQKSSSIKKNASNDLAVCSQKSVESVAYEKNSEELRLDEYDDKLFEYFGYKEKQQNDEMEEEEDLPDLGVEEMNDVNENETDDIIPGTSEVLKNLTSDMKKIKAMRFGMEETIDISDTPASSSATSSVQTSNETVKAITECSKSISRVKSLLGSKRTSSKGESSHSTTTSKGGSSQSTSISKGGTSHSATTTDKDDFSMISTQSDVISTQYQNKVRDEVEELQQEMAKLKKELADMSSVRDSESVLQQGSEKDMFAPSAEATEKGATADNEVTEKVFMCSLLKGSEFSQVVKLSESVGSSRVVRNFSPEVTHVIVKCDLDLVAERTLKFLYGVANGCYILDFSWVQESIKHNKLVDCHRFETFDSTGTNGPYKGRMNKGKLFQNTSFHFVPPFTEVQFDQLKELVSLCGGSSVNYMDEFLEVTNALCVIVMQVEDGDENGRLKAVELGKRVGRVVVAYDWVIECIGMYSLVSLDNYLLSDMDPKALEASGVTKRMLQETQEL